MARPAADRNETAATAIGAKKLALSLNLNLVLFSFRSFQPFA